MQATIKVNGPSGPISRDVAAYQTGTPGLIVHRRVNPKGPSTGWVLTHHASGLALSGYGFKTRAQAVAFAGVIASLADWTLDQRELRAVEGLYGRMSDARSRFDFELASSRS